MIDRVVERVRGDERAGEPEAGLVLEVPVDGNHFQEFLLRADIILQIEVRFTDQQKRIVHPFRALVFAQHVRALLDRVVEILLIRNAFGLVEYGQINGAIDALIRRSFDGTHALGVLLPRVIKRIVIGREVIESAPDKGPLFTPGDQNEDPDHHEDAAGRDTAHTAIRHSVNLLP